MTCVIPINRLKGILLNLHDSYRKFVPANQLTTLRFAPANHITSRFVLAGQITKAADYNCKPFSNLAVCHCKPMLSRLSQLTLFKFKYMRAPIDL